jgi:UDP-N-acetylmuramate--alanine ligase
MFTGEHVHLMGVGGCGVSALVPLLLRAGARVSGCDLQRSAAVKRLCSSGIDVLVGHDASHVAGIDIIVHTSAVEPDHMELRAAREAGIPVLSRSACLAELMRGHKTVAIAGSHGKTTTTWFTGHLLARAGVDPVVMVGGSVPELGNAGTRLGQGAWFVAEVDESDGGFRHVDPSIAVVTNLDDEHLRHYGGRDGLQQAFRQWLSRVPADGRTVITAGSVPPSLLDGLAAPVLRCSVEEGDYRVVDLRIGAESSTGRVLHGDQDLGELQVPLPGRHNVENALCALAAARCISSACCPTALADCERVARRFTVHGQPRQIRVVEDYAHHPTEIRAVIAAAARPNVGVHVLFQPHRYSRTADLYDDFVVCFDRASSLTLLPIYAAAEDPIPGVSARLLGEAIAMCGRLPVQYTRQREAALRHIAATVRPGDTVLLLGAGDVGRLAPQLVEVLTCPD